MELAGRCAVVIGGGSGIGRGIALALAAESMSVVVADIEIDNAERVAEELAATGADAIAVRVDATDRASLADLRDRSVERFGGVHLLSNNVGVAAIRRIDEATDEDWAWAIEFNLMAAVRAVDVFLPVLRAQDGAHIVNTASTAALVVITSPEHGWGAGQPIALYTATKHALLGYTETLRAELAADRIGVSALCPGGVPSNLRTTSARLRPDRYGGPRDPGPPAPPPPPTATPTITAEEVGRIVARGVKGNRLLILTHPQWANDVTRRYETTTADFEYFGGD